jgi:hypothetical protein
LFKNFYVRKETEIYTYTILVLLLQMPREGEINAGELARMLAILGVD